MFRSKSKGRFWSDRSGSALIQYGLVAGVLAVAVAGSGNQLKSGLRDKLVQIGLALGALTDPLVVPQSTGGSTGDNGTGGQS